MGNAFVDKLRGYAAITADDADILEAACRNQRRFPARHDLIREGEKPGPVFVILEGWACRYKILPEGGRQITAFLMPGDFCDMHVAILDEMDHNIATVTKSVIAMIPRELIQELMETRPSMTRAFWWTQLVDEAVLRAWIVSMGRRNSLERVAHLMCELYARMLSVGLAEKGRCELPLTQIVLADSLGLTAIHVNRVLRQLRNDRLMELDEGKLIIVDAPGLARVAGFDANYLHRWKKVRKVVPHDAAPTAKRA